MQDHEYIITTTNILTVIIVAIIVMVGGVLVGTMLGHAIANVFAWLKS